MITITLEMSFLVGGTGPEQTVDDVDALDLHTDEVFGHLLALEHADLNLADADMDVSLVERVVTLRITGSGDTRDDALDLTGASIRAAIHAAGGSTPGWRSPSDPDSPAVVYEFKSLATV